MMKFDIKNRFTGRVQFAAEIDCLESASISVKIGLAVRWAIKTGADMSYADMRYADMRGVDMRNANMRGADMRGVDMRNANMRNANMRNANMSYANMRGVDMRNANMRNANMRGADMSYANMRGADIFSCGSRSDGYTFYAQIKDGGLWIIAGCRYFSIKDADKHWRDTREGTQLGDESQQLLKNARAIAKIRKML